MRQQDLLTLFDFGYWLRDRVLASAAKLTNADFTAPSGVTTRDLRGTLVHTLDVELSWRARLRGEDEAVWKRELRVTDYPNVARLTAHWRRDESEMRAWLATLDDDALARAIDLGATDVAHPQYPLWFYLLHIHTHTQQQLSDAAVLLTRMRQSPGDLDFLNYADDRHRISAAPR
jgi:uncharacterized damage-inducible protein DinB